MDHDMENYQRFLNGNDAGLIEIIRMHKDGLILYLNGFTNNIHVAEDLSEDTFVKLFIKKPKFKGKSTFRTWLYAIGRNTALDYLRRASKTKEVSYDLCEEILHDEHTFEESYLQEEWKIEVHNAMKKLKPAYRQILHLVYFEEFTVKESAVILKKTVHSTEMLVSRARVALKTILEKENINNEKL